MEITSQETLIYTGIIVAVIVVGLLMYQKEILFLFRKKETKGVIVNWMSSVEKGKKFYYPMIEFEIPERGKITFRADDRCENKPLYERGTAVIIRYLPSDIEFRKVIYPKEN